MEIWVVRYRALGTESWTEFRLFSMSAAQAEFTERACAAIRAARGAGVVDNLCEVEMLDPSGVVRYRCDPSAMAVQS